jgi:hypothetical protein
MLETTNNEKIWAGILKEYYEIYFDNPIVVHYIDLLGDKFSSELQVLKDFQKDIVDEFNSNRHDELTRARFSTGIAISMALLNLRNGYSVYHSVDEAWNIAIKKHHDYGSENIIKFGLLGVLIRTSDKVSRMINLIENNRKTQNEPIRDSLLDIMNYCAYGLILLDNKWIS